MVLKMSKLAQRQKTLGELSDQLQYGNVKILEILSIRNSEKPKLQKQHESYSLTATLQRLQLALFEDQPKE